MEGLTVSSTTRIADVATAMLIAIAAGILAFCVVDAIVVWPRFPVMVDLESSPRFVFELLLLTLTYPAPPLAIFGFLLVARNASARSRVILPAVTLYVSVLCGVYALKLHAMVGVELGDLFTTELLRMLPASLATAVAFLLTSKRRSKARSDSPAVGS